MMFCTDCNQDKKHKAHGLCDACYAKWRRRQRLQLFRERDKKRWPNRRDRQNERRKEHYRRNKEHHLKLSKRYHETHKGQIRKQQAEYRAEHRDEIMERNRKYSRERRDKQKQLDRLKTFIANMPKAKRLELSRAATHRRMQRKQGLPATLTRSQWTAIKTAYDNRCAYCGIRKKNLTQDHVIPLSKGGGYTPENIVPACLSCNSRKGSGPPPQQVPVRLML